MSIQSEINRLNNAKADIASAVEELGVDVPAATSLDEMGDKVRATGDLYAKTAAPANVSGQETITAKFYTSNGGSVSIGKEGPNSGTMLRFDQTDGTCRLRFRGSATAGAMVWEQPEKNAALHMDLGDSTGTKKRLSFSASGINANAASATKLTTSAGSATQPVYFSDGKPVKTTHTLGASVPANAKFTDTTYSDATQSAAGLMGTADKVKLDGIAEGANKTTVDTALSSTSTNPVQNKVVNTALAGKVKKVTQTATVLGTSKTTEAIGDNQLVFPKGGIFSGTAANAGLVTRGICGVTSPSATGACEKENLYINYDGDNTYRNNRHLILQASSAGTHYGNNLYQNAAARGDAVKGWVESKGYATKAYVDAKLPASTTANNGQFLSVVNGSPAWVSIPNAEGASF